jgi:hypothetical protein
MKVLPSDVQPVTLDVKEDESLLVLDRLSGVNSGIADAGPNLRGKHCAVRGDLDIGNPSTSGCAVLQALTVSLLSAPE